MARQMFRCYIYGKDSDWEAICTDLDISVQGGSSEEAQLLLKEAVAGFLEVLEEESADDRRRLLNRKSPIWLRVSLYVWCVLHGWQSEKQSQKKIAREYISPHNLVTT